MVAGGAGGDVQLLADLPVAAALGHQPQHLHLPCRERFRRGRPLWVRSLPGRPAGRIDKPAPLHQLFHGMHQGAGAPQALLQHHRIGAAGQGRLHQHPVVVGEQQHTAVLGRPLADRRHQIQARPIRQVLAHQQIEGLLAAVEDRQGRLPGAGDLQSAQRRGRFAGWAAERQAQGQQAREHRHQQVAVAQQHQQQIPPGLEQRAIGEEIHGLGGQLTTAAWRRLTGG